MKDLQKEMNIQKQKSENEIFGYQSEIKLLKDDKCKLEKEIMDTKSSCELLENKNRNLENYVEDCKKNEVSVPDIVYIDSKAEQTFDCMICFLE